MKESNFYSDEFEHLIREKTEQYNMYPSENVWKGVHNSLHTKRKWFYGSMALLVTGILFFSGKELLAPGHTSHKLAGTGAVTTDGLTSDPSRSWQPEDNARSNFVRVHPINPAAASGHHLTAAGNPGGEPEETDQPANHLAITISHPVVSQPDLSELLSHAVQLPGAAPSLIGSDVPAEVTVNEASVNGATVNEATVNKVPETPPAERGLLDSWLVRNAPAHPTADALHNNAETLRETSGNNRETAEAASVREARDKAEADDAYVRSVIESLSARGQQRIQTRSEIARNPSARQGSVQENIKDSAGIAKASADEIGEASDLSRVNWLHDYAVYSLPPSQSRGRLHFQLVLAPTVNYRNLHGSALATSKEFGGPVATVRPGDVETWVDHAPALGFEFGANVLYRVTRNLTVKGGLQFNYSRYRMLAYTTQQQLANQPADYRTPYGYMVHLDSIGAQPPSISPNASLSAGDGVQATLYNDYYQLSAPVGFDLRILGNERLQLNIGATLQPSYLLNTDSYILSSDFTNYTKAPAAIRRWNVSGGVEAFLSYQTGLLRWQIGPEFRYQFFSTDLSTSTYPISENLKGYGLKIGITKPLP